VPNLIVNIPELNAYTFGYLVYFFEKAVAMSGYLLFRLYGQASCLRTLFC
jgi:glucose-6-phosphate isomerase